jgi:hypothetical protein
LYHLGKWVCCQCVAEQGDVSVTEQSGSNDVTADADKEKSITDGYIKLLCSVYWNSLLSAF